MDRKEIEEKNKLLDEKFSKNRAEWSVKLMALIKMIKDVQKIPEAQVLMLSYRHMITDLIAELQSRLYKHHSSYENYFKIKFVEYSTGYNLKLNGGEKEKFVKADLSSLKRQGSMIESHIDFYRECVRTLDNMGFAIRNRIHVATDLN